MKIVEVRGIKIGTGRPKICIPVMEKRTEDIVEMAEQAVMVGADLIEWRADAWERLECDRLPGTLKALRTRIGQVPLLFTIRTSSEGGLKALSPEEYTRLNQTAIESGVPDLIDVEMGREPKAVERIIAAAHEAGVSVVGSYHDFFKTPSVEAMVERLQKAWDGGADILKLAVMPETMDDVVRLLDATQKASSMFDRPLITMSMGAMGSISRVWGEYFGSAVTFGQMGQASAPGQFDAGELRTVLDIFHKQASQAGQVFPDREDGGSKDKNMGLSARSRGSDKALEKKIRHLFLTGFMGTGKTSVARELEKLTGMPVMEMDEELARREGRSIPDIFAAEGEGYFRQIETQLLQDIAREETAMIVSCGGGAVLAEKNTQLMKSCGKVVLLTARPETIYARVGGDEGRPNLKGRKSPKDIEALMTQREPKYKAAADVVVETDRKDIKAIAREILAVCSE